MGKMKIAVQLFGHLRTYDRCWKSLKKHLLDKYDCDVFMHTWSTVDHQTKTWHTYHTRGGNNLVDETLVRQRYHLTDVVIEEQKLQDLGIITALKREISIFGIQCMFHSMCAVNDLRRQYAEKTGTKYDFVVFIRPDVYLYEDFSIEKFIYKEIPDNLGKKVFHAGKPTVSTFDFEHVNGTDIIFFARPNIFDMVFQGIPTLIKTLKNGMDLPYGPEYLLIKSEAEQGYQSVLMNYLWDKDFCVARPFRFKSARRNAIRIHVKGHEMYIHLLSTLDSISFEIRFSIFGYGFYCAIGRSRSGV